MRRMRSLLKTTMSEPRTHYPLNTDGEFVVAADTKERACKSLWIRQTRLLHLRAQQLQKRRRQQQPLLPRSQQKICQW
eukprot:COSAG05_NODE_56_length_23335_cov_15.221338_23_plen_78_part_00